MMTSRLCCFAVCVLALPGIEASPKTCSEVYSSATNPSSGTYTLANAAGQPFTVYCLFRSGYGYTFISPSTTVDPNIAGIFTEKTEVLIRHKRTNGNQYDATAAQISRYSSTSLGLLYNSYSGYNEVVNSHMSPYLYLGFVPKPGVSHRHDTQGWKIQGIDYRFTNCDGNPNSYFSLLYNQQNQAYGPKTHGKTALLWVWYDHATSASSADYIPDSFFASQFEIHFGGCGGFQTSTSFTDVFGVTFGLRFNIDECASNPCQNGATCNNNLNSYSCLCAGGWQGVNCQTDINECASNPCQNGATCNNNLAEYTCTCVSGWQEDNCQLDINECGSNPCKNGATCVNLLNMYACTCVAGWQGTNCDEDINECASNPCQNGATCNNNLAEYTCTCVSGWQGDNCQLDINECASNPCKNGATCDNLLNMYACTCVAGWQGTNCDEDINECASNPCQNGATCNNNLAEYTCTCASGWQGDNCQLDINECASNPCKNGATCDNLLNMYACTCVAGWQGTNCDEDINECASNPCQNGATCNNNLAEYTCTCVSGWQGDNCQLDINECASNPCKNGATCDNLLNMYACTCVAGWQGTNCDEDINECTSNPCQNGATCNNNLAEYTCTCVSGWQGDNCQLDINECASNPCKNGATCVNLLNMYACTCVAGWQGTNCDEDIDECVSSPCQNGATCDNQLNMYACTCAPGWQGTDCEQDIDECASNPCQNDATCSNYQNSYSCACVPGWQGTNCETDVDECASSPCQNGATCNNLVNHYTCTCAEGWIEYNCQTPNVTFICYPNNTIDVHYLPPGVSSYAMQNVTAGNDVQCTITTVDSRTITLTGCNKDLPILLSLSSYSNMETYQIHAGTALTAIEIKCNEIASTGVVHDIYNTLGASLTLDEEAAINPTYDVTSDLNVTTVVVGDPVKWTISFPVEYILEVTDCTAYSGTDNTGSLSVPLITAGGCQSDAELISAFSDNMDGSAEAVILAFKFYEVENVFLECNVNVCPDTAGEQCDTSCSRTKRDVRRDVREASRDKPQTSFKKSLHNVLRVVEGSSSTSNVQVSVFVVGASLAIFLATSWIQSTTGYPI